MNDKKETDKKERIAVSRLKRYAIHGYLEYMAHFQVGKVGIDAHFKGGSLSGYGTYPAIYETSHPALQAVIENSRLFREGIIKEL